MVKHNCELFGHMLYSPDISYNELYALEADLIDELHDALEKIGAEHIDLVGLGDALRVQCVLTEYSEPIFHDLCDTVAEFLPKKVLGRFLFVHKDLSVVHLYCFLENGWKEAAVDISMQACVIADKDPETVTLPDAGA